MQLRESAFRFFFTKAAWDYLAKWYDGEHPKKRFPRDDLTLTCFASLACSTILMGIDREALNKLAEMTALMPIETSDKTLICPSMFIESETPFGKLVGAFLPAIGSILLATPDESHTELGSYISGVVKAVQGEVPAEAPNYLSIEGIKIPKEHKAAAAAAVFLKSYTATKRDEKKPKPEPKSAPEAAPRVNPWGFFGKN